MSAFLRQRPGRRLSVAAILGAWLFLVNPLATGAEIDFYRDVYPILKTKCIACHNKTTTKAALNMETPETMRQGGDSGEGVIPGNGAESLIFEAAAHTGDLEMPPKNNKSGATNLTPDELALLKSWIDQGAKSSNKQARQVVWQPLPPGLNPIYSVAMTRDGRFAACGRANQIFVYDLANRQLVARLADESLNQQGTPTSTGAAHRAIVQSLAFSPDGTRLASGSFRELKIWRREDVVNTPREGDPALGAVVSVLSADGKQVVCADEQGALHVLDATNGKVLKSIPAGVQNSAVTQLTLSEDGTKAVTYDGADRSLSLWNLEDGRGIARTESDLIVRSLAWTRDGKAIATGGDDKVLRIWSLPTEQQSDFAVLKELKGATGSIISIETGNDLVIAATDDGKVRSWSISDAKPVLDLTIPGVLNLGLASDGKRFAAARVDGVVQIWDLAAGKKLNELSGDTEMNAQVAALEWAVAVEKLEETFQKQEVARIEAQNKALDALLKKANETIATVRKDLVDKENALKQATAAKEKAQKAEAEAAEQVAKAPDGKTDASLEKAHTDAQDQLKAAALAESEAQAALKAREIHLKDAEVESQNYSAAQSRNKNAIAAANDAAVKAKAAQDKATSDVATLRRRAATDPKLRPLAVRFSSDDQTVATVLSDGTLCVWAVASGLPVGNLPGLGTTASASLVDGPDGAFAASTAEGSTSRLSTRSGWVLERTIGGESAASPFVDRVNALRFSPDGKTLAAGGGEPTRSGDISLWDVASGNLIEEWKERHNDMVLSLDFTPDGKRLASGGADKIARVTDIATGKLVNVFEGHTHHVLGVSFRADGRVLATAGADNFVVVWDMISGERKQKIAGWNKEVTSLQFIGATDQILTSAGDNLVRIVNDRGGQIRDMAKLPDFMQSAASGPTASVLIGGGEDSMLRVWNGTTGQELAVFGVESNTKTP